MKEIDDYMKTSIQYKNSKLETPTYQDLSTIQWQEAPSGELYAIPDKPTLKQPPSFTKESTVY